MNKVEGREIKGEEDLKRVIMNFFFSEKDNAQRTQIISYLAEKVSDLTNIVSSIESIRFFSASILIIIETDPELERQTPPSIK